MHSIYVPRNIELELAECLKSFPAVAVLGPRRSGKSTLAKAMIALQEAKRLPRSGAPLGP